LQGSQFPGDVGIDIDGEILGFLDQEELIDLVAQGIGRVFADGFLEFDSGETFGAEALFDLLARLFQFAAGNNVAVHFGGNFFHDPDIGSDGGRQRRKAEHYKPANHMAFLLVYRSVIAILPVFVRLT
jgi:hypothetical protein